jgi:hypothetical protein
VAAFYIEDGVSPRVAMELGYLAHWATTADAQGRKGANDEEHLWLAAQHGWILVTHNAADFRMLHRAWLLWNVPLRHAGILVLPQQPGTLARQMALDIDALLQSHPPLENRLYGWQPRTGWVPHP